MESRTLIKNVNISPKKLRFLAREVSRLKPVVAIEYLTFTPKKGARLFATAIKSAISNATFVLKTDAQKLVFKSLAVDEGIKLKRYNPGGRGMVKPYRKKFSHIKIVLTASKAQTPVKPAVEEIKKEEVKKVTSKKPVKKAAVK